MHLLSFSSLPSTPPQIICQFPAKVDQQEGKEAAILPAEHLRKVSFPGLCCLIGAYGVFSVLAMVRQELSQSVTETTVATKQKNKKTLQVFSEQLQSMCL